MPKINEIRATYDAQTITVYQAYAPNIAAPAVQAQRFVAPFSFGRMTWIKPSFLWLMERSNWARKSGQENIVAVRITRSGWEEALSLGVLTSHEAAAYRDASAWRAAFDAAPVIVQWDPERSIRGADVGFNSIQVGLSHHIIEKYVAEWIVEISDCTPLVRKIHALLQAGHADKAKKLLPAERVYEVNEDVARRLNMR